MENNTESQYDAPPVWFDHRDRPPSRPISHAIIYINGDRKGRMNQPDVSELTKEGIMERFPELYSAEGQEVRLDFRSEQGRGSLAHITYTEGEAIESRHDGMRPDLAELSSTHLLVDQAQRLMAQNERLHKQLLEATTANAQNTVDTHERMVTMLAASMERDRTRQGDWLEREAQLRQAAFERSSTQQGQTANANSQLIELLVPLLSNQQSGAMDGVQEMLAAKLAEGMMDKIEGINQPEPASDPMGQLLQGIGPLIAAKLAPEGAVPPGPPTPA